MTNWVRVGAPRGAVCSESRSGKHGRYQRWVRNRDCHMCTRSRRVRRSHRYLCWGCGPRGQVHIWHVSAWSILCLRATGHALSGSVLQTQWPRCPVHGQAVGVQDDVGITSSYYDCRWVERPGSPQGIRQCIPVGFAFSNGSAVTFHWSIPGANEKGDGQL